MPATRGGRSSDASAVDQAGSEQEADLFMDVGGPHERGDTLVFTMSRECYAVPRADIEISYEYAW